LTNYWTTYMQYLQSGAQEHNLQCQTVSKSMLWGWTFKAIKMSGQRGYLIKKPSGWQSVNSNFMKICTLNSHILTDGHIQRHFCNSSLQMHHKWDKLTVN
jgi:hypothetical protein